jgi:hypothetical protein
MAETRCVCKKSQNVAQTIFVKTNTSTFSVQKIAPQKLAQEAKFAQSGHPDCGK